MSASDAVIRAAREADVDQCIALGIFAAPERSADEWRGTFVEDIEDAERYLVVAERAGTIAGYGRARLFEPASDAPADTCPRGYYLTGVFVAESERRAGLGTALMAARIDWIAGRAAEAWSFANARNTPSIALHERHGFEEVGRQFSYPGLTFEGGEGILFRLRLDGEAGVG